MLRKKYLRTERVQTSRMQVSSWSQYSSSPRKSNGKDKAALRRLGVPGKVIARRAGAFT